MNCEWCDKDRLINVLLFFGSDFEEVVYGFFLGDVVFVFEMVWCEVDELVIEFYDYFIYLMIYGVFYFFDYDY